MRVAEEINIRPARPAELLAVGVCGCERRHVPILSGRPIKYMQLYVCMTMRSSEEDANVVRGAFPAADASAAERDRPGVIATPPLIYIVGLAIGFGLEALLPSASLPGALAWSLGSGLLIAGLALAASFFNAFRGARTPVDVRKPTTAIVTTGPYRLSRNPGYLSLALIYVGVTVLTGALWALVPLVPTLVLVDRGVIAREERYLERKFGDEYLRYKARTRRWL